jgi:2-oxoisovalerate dehydrogenase E2 component (dihydrolipoyl transacylase)
MSNQTFLLPDLGEGLADAEIVAWLVQVGDTVAIDDVVVEVETAKASVEVPVPFAGTVVELHGDVGSTLTVGSPLITVATSGPATAAPGAADLERHRDEERAGSGNVLIGYGTSEPRRRRRRRAPVSQQTSAPVTPAASTAIKVISPLVRTLLRDSGIDPKQILATGAGGVITRADVTRALTQPEAEPHTSISDSPAEQRIPLKGIRKAVADKLSVSRREIPDATIWVDTDATALLEAKSAIAPASGSAVSLLALLARFATAALRQFPELNSSVDRERSEIVQFRHVNLGIAVQSTRGLTVPVIKHADELNAVELSKVLGETIALAREGTLPPAQYSGGTFTLNNYGVFGVDGSTPIINHPEAAILGIGRIIDRPWVVDGELAIRKMTQLVLSFDHRVCDGDTAGGFLRLFADFVENPVAAIGRL